MVTLWADCKLSQDWIFALFLHLSTPHLFIRKQVLFPKLIRFFHSNQPTIDAQSQWPKDRYCRVTPFVLRGSRMPCLTERPQFLQNSGFALAGFQSKGDIPWILGIQVPNRTNFSPAGKKSIGDLSLSSRFKNFLGSILFSIRSKLFSERLET